MYRNGKLHGKVTGWHENGRKMHRGEYKNNLPCCKWTFWLKNGRRVYRGEWQKGKKWYDKFIGGDEKREQK